MSFKVKRSEDKIRQLERHIQKLHGQKSFGEIQPREIEKESKSVSNRLECKEREEANKSSREMTNDR